MTIPESLKPKFLNEEAMHQKYSVGVAENHYKQIVYPTQREGWYHGRVFNNYRQNYDKIKWRKVRKS